jgi:hypothetical protein
VISLLRPSREEGAVSRHLALHAVAAASLLAFSILVGPPAGATHIRCFGLPVPHDSEHLGTEGQDNLEGDGGNDVMHGRGNPNTAPDHLLGYGGADKMCGGDNYDLMWGGRGHDKMSGGRYDDTIQGGTGNDTIKGGKRNDDLFGGDGDDQIWDGWGEDWLSGGPGHDTVVLCDNDQTERYINDFEEYVFITC